MIENQFRLAQIQAQKQGHDGWLRLRRMALDFYYSLSQDYVKDFYTARHLSFISVANHNLTKRIINRTSLVYMQSPVRTIDGELSELYESMTQRKDAKMQRLERYVNLLNLEVIRPVWDAIAQRFDYYLITDFEVETSSTDPLVPVAIKYPVAASSSLSETSEQLYERWDRNSVQVMDEHGNIRSNMEHGYGVLPVVFVFRDGIPENMFLDVYPAMDIIEANLGVNIMLTDLRMNQRFQGHGKFWAKGVDKDTSITLSPQVVSIFENPDASLNVASPPNNTQSAIEAIKNEYRLIAVSYGLDPSVIEGVSPQSGVALRIRNQELTDNRKGSLVTFRKAEQDLFALEMDMLRVHDPELAGKLGETIQVDFGEEQNIMTPDEQRKQDDWDLDHNLTNLVEIYRRKNPDDPDPEAAIMRNKAVNTGAPSLEDVLNG